MSLELNKIAAAVLTAGVVAMGTGFVSNLLIQPDPPKEPVYTVALKEDTGGGGAADGGSGGSGGGAEEQGPDLATLLADASASSGEQASRVCAACHSFNEGGPHKVGPNLYNVVGTDIASADGFNYSQALQDKQGKWTYEKLAGYLENPNGWAPGNNMSYQGIKDPQKLANVIAYLRQQTDNPPPLPEPETQAAGAAAEGETAASDAGAGDTQTAAGEAGDPASGEKASGDMAADGSDQAAAEGQDAADGQDAGETQTAKATQATGGGDSADGGGGSGLEQKVASADPSAGKSAVAVCSACHSFNKGGPNKVGPNLYDVMGAKVASVDGFNYSDALKGVGGEWTVEKVDAYLENPNEFAPGNRMTYPGVKDDQKRHNIIAYMLQQSDKASGN
jgi:cytochrome c